MNIIPLGSSSAGNCYIAECNGDYIMLDAGLSVQTIKRYFPRLSKLSGAVITHEHGDHSAAYAGLLHTGVNIYLSAGTNAKLSEINHYRAHIVRAFKSQMTKDEKWSVYPLPAIHDAAEPLGFLIKHLASKQTIYYMTDTGKYPTAVNNATHYMIECNYDPELLKRGIMNGELPPMLAKRIARNHASINQVEGFLKRCKLDKTESVYLLHLSNGNSNEADFKKRVQKVCGLPTYVCAQ